MPHTPIASREFRPVSLWRRLAAIVYDSFAVFAVCFVASALAVTLHHGQAIANGSWWFTACLGLVCYGYFAHSWRRGRTLGMRSWKLRLVDAATGEAVSWRQTVLRFAVALLGWLPAGMGYWRSLWDDEQRTWHDLVSATRLVRD
jgi:uncharacterized RDD family membrane protein YckC